MVGANQITEAECDVAYARAEGIGIVRRASGGGAIFTDSETLQVTVILPFETETRSRHCEDVRQGDGSSVAEQMLEDGAGVSTLRHCGDGTDEAIHTVGDHKAAAKDWLTVPVIDTLASCGVRASLEGRNDIVIDGRKISGLAQYIKEGYICSHCSLLFRTDLEKLERCLTVDKSKYTTKAIASVRARVANISDHTAGQDMQSFRERLIETYMNADMNADINAYMNADMNADMNDDKSVGERRFDGDELAAIDSIKREKYLNPEWTYGREPAFTFTKKKRFPGGLLEVFLDVKGGVIREARINGDFLSLVPVAELEEKLKGVPHRADTLADALSSIDVKAYLGSLGAPEFLEVLL